MTNSDKINMWKNLPDPYDVFDEWVEFKSSYCTYVKGCQWITDGELVELTSYHKEEPYPRELSNGKIAVYWMFPGNKYPYGYRGDKQIIPPVPNKIKGELCHTN